MEREEERERKRERGRERERERKAWKIMSICLVYLFKYLPSSPHALMSLLSTCLQQTVS
jgi:hypothetical protein